MLRGGLSIASGSDGCVFDGTFAEDGTFTKDDARVTKVYSPQRADIAKNEWDAMNLVKSVVPDGKGVVVAEGPPQTIATVPETSFEDGNKRNACEELDKVITSGNPHDAMLGLVLPRISGTLYELYIDGFKNNKKLSLPAMSFADIVTAVEKMGDAGIAHMDFAVRNVFYKEEGGNNILLLGDFGNTFKIGDDIDERVKTYVNRYNLRGVGRFRVAISNIDGVHPIAVAIMVLYDALLAGERVYEDLLNKEIRAFSYVSRTRDLVDNMWAAKMVKSLKVDASVVNAFLDTLAKKLETVFGIFAAPGRGYKDAEAAQSGIRSILQKTLKRSDRCLLDLMVLKYQEGALTTENITKLTETWFPSPKKGGKKQQGGQQPIKDAASLEEALARPVPDMPKLEEQPSMTFPSLAEGIKQLGGGAKTRRNRVKMSRRK